MVSLGRTNISIVLVTICLFNIFPTNVNTSPTIIDGKYSLDTFLHPVQDKKECNNYYTNNQYLCDPNNYLTYPNKQKLGRVMQKSQTNPIISCPFGNNGIQFGVLIISSFNDYHSNKINQGFSIAETSKFYAKLLHEKWKIGNDECNNGVFIFLNVNDRFLHVSTSTFLRTNYITDDFINNDIMPQITSYLKSKQYKDGIIKIIDLITDKCQIQLIDKMVEREKHKYESANTEKIVPETQNSTIYNIFKYGLWMILIIIIVTLFLIWLIWYTLCCCCDKYAKHDNRRNMHNNAYQDEGVPFNQPGIPQNNNNNNRDYNVNRMGYNNNLRSRNVYNTYPNQHFNNAERLRKERERKEREQLQREEILRKKRTDNGMSFDDNYNQRLRKEKEERLRKEKEVFERRKRLEREGKELREQKLRLEQQRKNEEMVNKGKRIQNGGGGGMSWDDANAPNTAPVYKPTNDGGGSGMSFGDNSDRLRKEMEEREVQRAMEESLRQERIDRERREREEKLRLEQQKKNEKIVSEGKRIKNGGGGGMSWDDNDNEANAPNEEPIYKRTSEGGGGGGYW